MFTDNKSTDFEMSVEVDQQVNEESLGNTIESNLLFSKYTYTFSTTKHNNSYPCCIQ